MMMHHEKSVQDGSWEQQAVAAAACKQSMQKQNLQDQNFMHCSALAWEQHKSRMLTANSHTSQNGNSNNQIGL